jgi:hypothetical protein
MSDTSLPQEDESLPQEDESLPQEEASIDPEVIAHSDGDDEEDGPGGTTCNGQCGVNL